MISLGLAVLHVLFTCSRNTMFYYMNLAMKSSGIDLLTYIEAKRCRDVKTITSHWLFKYLCKLQNLIRAVS